MLHEDQHSTSEWAVGESNLPHSSEDNIQQATESFSSNLNNASEINENSLSHPFLIGLDRHFFEQGDDPKDVILIDNGGLKFDGAEIKIEGNNSSGQKSFLASGNYLISLVEPSTSVSWDQSNLRHIRFIRADTQENESVALYTCCVDSSISHNTCGLFENDGKLNEDSEGTIIHTKKTFDLDCNLDPGEECRNNATKIHEKNLPLKKKAKMKSVKFVKHSSNMTSIFSEAEPKDESKTESQKAEIAPATLVSQSQRFKKRMAGKRRCCYSDSDMSDCEDSCQTEIVGKTSYDSITELIADLKLKNLVDEEFSCVLETGIKEMEANLIEELNSSMEENFSFQLLTFAFLLYFKKRPAYAYLRQVYKRKWPTVANLKEWKQAVNSKPRQRKKVK